MAKLLEQITALNKNISSIQGDIRRWKEQEQQFSAEEEIYDADESLPASRPTSAIDLVMESTAKSSEIPPINEEAPVLAPSPIASHHLSLISRSILHDGLKKFINQHSRQRDQIWSE